jgi:Bacterial PH domain
LPADPRAAPSGHPPAADPAAGRSVPTRHAMDAPCTPHPEPDPPQVERFRPGGVRHALISGLAETALASALLGTALEVESDQEGVAAALTAAGALWAVLAAYSLLLAALRAWVFEAALDQAGVTLRGPLGTRRLGYADLSAVEVRGARTWLVGRDSRRHPVRGVRGRAQGTRFRTRVLARAHAAAEIADSRQEPYSRAQADHPDKQAEHDQKSGVADRGPGGRKPPDT